MISSRHFRRINDADVSYRITSRGYILTALTRKLAVKICAELKIGMLYEKDGYIGGGFILATYSLWVGRANSG